MYRYTLPLLPALLALSGIAVAQTAPPPSTSTALGTDSGFLTSTSAKESVVFRHRLQFTGTPWLQVHFGKGSSLPAGSYLLLTSARDGAVQRLDGRELADWTYDSAFFNGGTLHIELIAAPRSAGNRVVLERATLGLAPAAPDTICGNTDDRVLSNDPRQGRLSSGCTGWLINTDVMLTAGHCDSTGATGVLELNVPLSTANGTVVRSHPDDQYPYQVLQSLSAGIGADWAVARVSTNSNTGQLPTQANGGQWYTLGSVPSSPSGQTIRITGYGTTSPRNSWSQVQKTHTGPLAQIGATSLCYQTDTTGGNSGSPIIHENTGNPIGIHSHGGCTTSGGCNSGTRIDRSDLQQAIAAANPNAAAFNTYGAGCPVPPVFYELFQSGNDAGTTYRFTANAQGGWDVTLCTRGCFDPNFSNNLNLGDDQLATNLPLGFSFNLPGTRSSTTAIDVDSNGWIGLVAGQHTGSDFSESVSELLNDPARLAAWWDDLNPSAGGGVYFDTTRGKATVTWNNVPEFPSTGANTVQVQLFANGDMIVHYASRNSSSDGLVGYSPGNVARDPGSLDLSAAVPFSTSAGGTPLALSASSLPVLGQNAVLNLANLPSNTSGAFLNLGLQQASGDLSGLGMPGCRLLTSIAASLNMSIRGSSASSNLPVPNQSALIGALVYAQGVALASGVNARGVATSNGGTMQLGL